MFEHLAKHKKILVTGPHRSGTTFTATAIAHDTGHGLIREELSGFSAKKLSYWLTEAPGPVVCQAPYAADKCHLFGAFVVFMMRDLKDIEASQQRMKLEDGKPVNWDRMERGQRRLYHAKEGAIAELKYQNWTKQREKIANYLEVDYESLRGHPLWVDKAKWQPYKGVPCGGEWPLYCGIVPVRDTFHVRQTHVG